MKDAATAGADDVNGVENGKAVEEEEVEVDIVVGLGIDLAADTDAVVEVSGKSQKYPSDDSDGESSLVRVIALEQ